MALPNIRGTQIGLRDPTLVGRLKSDMRTGRYAFEDERGQIGGVLDSRGIYHIIEGHHRMVAAMELSREIGDDEPVAALLRWGKWSIVDKPPVDSRPLPSRTRWGAFRNWLGI
jgi:hypothetical protein